MKTIKNVLIKKVTSPNGIVRIAEDRGIPTSEVFVRVVFKYNDKDYTVSQKFGFLSRKQYEKLLNVVDTDTTIDLDVDLTSGFFYVHEEVDLDTLYASVPKREFTTNNLAELSDLI